MASSDDQEDRRLLAILAVLFVILLAGCSALPDSSDGKGELTVTVVDKQGDPVDRQTVIIRNTETSNVVFQGKTGPNGQVSTRLESGEYVVAPEDTTHTVNLDESSESVTLSISPAPPKLDESDSR